MNNRTIPGTNGSPGGQPRTGTNSTSARISGLPDKKPSALVVVLTVLTMLALMALSLAIEVLVVWLSLVVIGNFDLSFANILGISVMSWITYMALRNSKPRAD